jgi:hypothetical protein
LHFLVSLELRPLDPLYPFVLLLLSHVMFVVGVPLVLIIVIIKDRLALVSLRPPVKEHVVKPGFDAVKFVLQVQAVKQDQFF